MVSSLSSSSSSSKNSVYVDGVGDVEIRTSKRAKRLKLAVSARKGAYVVKPRRVSSAAAVRFIQEHEKWLKKHIAKLPERLSLQDGEMFSRTMSLSVVKDSTSDDSRIEEVGSNLELGLKSDSNLNDSDVQELLMKQVVKIWRREAKIYLPKRLEILSTKHDLNFNDVKVKYMHSRWGSCSSQNNINLNIQLMRLRPELIDHVLLHELCHTREHNHSKNFWELFESCESGAKLKTKELKKIDLF